MDFERILIPANRHSKMQPIALPIGINPTSITDEELKKEIERMVKTPKKDVADYNWWLIPTKRLSRIFNGKDKEKEKHELDCAYE